MKRKHAKAGRYSKIRRLKIDFRQLRREIVENRKQRMEFVKQYAEWLKRTPNSVWSKAQNKLLDK